MSRPKNEHEKPIRVKGTANVRQPLADFREDRPDAKIFDFEEDTMYSTRDGELIQQLLQQYGEMPGGGDEDDLY